MGKTAKLIDRISTTLVAREPVLILGPPGSGKSACIKGDVKAELERRLEIEPGAMGYFDWRLAMRDPVESLGLPWVDTKEMVTRWIRPEFLPKEGPLLICMEELNLASKAHDPMIYEALTEGRVGDHALPAETYIVATGNRKIDGCSVRKLNSAIEDRFAYFEWFADPDDWRKWARGAGLDPRVVAAPAWMPELITEFDGTSDGPVSTPRALHKLSNVLTRGNPSSEALIDHCVSYLGEINGTRVAGFFRIFDSLISPKRIANDPKGTEIINEPGALVALVTTLARVATSKTIEAYVTYVRRLGELNNFGRTYIEMFVRDVAEGNPAAAKSEAFIEFAAENPVLI